MHIFPWGLFFSQTHYILTVFIKGGWIWGSLFFGSSSLSTENSLGLESQVSLTNQNSGPSKWDQPWWKGLSFGGSPLFLVPILPVDSLCGRRALGLMSTGPQMRRSRSEKILAEGGVDSAYWVYLRTLKSLPKALGIQSTKETAVVSPWKVRRWKSSLLAAVASGVQRSLSGSFKREPYHSLPAASIETGEMRCRSKKSGTSEMSCRPSPTREQITSLSSPSPSHLSSVLRHKGAKATWLPVQATSSCQCPGTRHLFQTRDNSECFGGKGIAIISASTLYSEHRAGIETGRLIPGAVNAKVSGQVSHQDKMASRWGSWCLSSQEHMCWLCPQKSTFYWVPFQGPEWGWIRS